MARVVPLGPLADAATANPWPMGRRDFVGACLAAAAAVGLPAKAGARIAQAAREGLRPSVIWLSFQECTGCTESLLRTSHPSLDELVLELISLDYHEALMAPAGHQAEAARLQAMEAHRGAFVLVVEGAIPVKDGGIYCRIGGRTALEIVQEAAAMAGAVVAVGSCASWGGVSSAEPNPTGATGLPAVLEGRQVVTIPGCPPNPYNFLGSVLQFAVFGTLPRLDDKGRPAFAYGRTIHDHCPRRGHFDAGRFAKRFGDEGHHAGWCLYELGCKGPGTFANCATANFCEMPGAWPIGIGHPCFGCTEATLAFRVPSHEMLPVTEITPPSTYAPIVADHGRISPLATGVAGILAGAGAVAAWRTARRLDAEDAEVPAAPASERTDAGPDQEAP
jgi:hydrogenase small subunit